MNIFFITSGYYSVLDNKKSAIESLVYFLVEENENRNTHKFYIGTKKPIVDPKKYNNTDFLFYEVIHKNNIFYYIWYLIFRLFRMFDIDIPKHHYVYEIYKYAKNKKIDYFIVEEGDLYSFKYLSRKFGKEKMIYHSHSQVKYTQELLNIYDKFISPSKYIEEYNFQNYNSQIYRNKILLNSINENNFKKNMTEKENADIRNELHIEINDFVVVFVGRISEVKGVKQLISAWNRINCFNKKLILIGSTQFGTNVVSNYEKNILNEIKSNASIISLGFIPNDQISKYHNISDLFISPSIMEPAGMMNLEAMCSGLPILSTNEGGIPEYVINNRNGILINDINNIEEFANKIEELMRNKEMLLEFSKNNLIDSKKYYKSEYYSRFCKIINEFQNNESK
ncbi:MAG: glycosyltransferase family 4 protein [Bacilli bacterium]